VNFRFQLRFAAGWAAVYPQEAERGHDLPAQGKIAAARIQFLMNPSTSACA